MLTTAQLAVLQPPTGWLWVSKPTIRTAGRLRRDTQQKMVLSNAPKMYKALYEWAVKNSIGLTTTTNDAEYVYHQYDDYAFSTAFGIVANKPELTIELFGTGTEAPCWQCGQRTPIGSLRCKNAACQSRLQCGSCSITGPLVRLVSTWSGRNVRLCANCGPVCSGARCDRRVYLAERGRKRGDFGQKCHECAPVAACFSCNTVSDKTKMKSITYRGENRHACKDCYNAYVCPECNNYKKAALTEVEGKSMCKACATVVLDKLRVKYEKFDPAELPSGGSLLIPSLPTRPFRLVSIETEVDGDKDALSGTLFRCGIVRVPEVESYHSYPSNKTEWAAHLKHDGSVTGGELISHCLNLDTKEHSDVLMDTLKKLKSLEKLDKISYSHKCGGHIHIDAHNFGFGDVWRLLTIWNFLEDVIYRLAGAGHKYGHRTLVPGHDSANGGIGYSKKVVKGPFGTKGVVGQVVRQQERMSGLNFVPYLGAIAGCECGAFAGNGDGRNCKCSLEKATIEWRVWNSQGNPRILHAWIAFMQALHAYADQGEDPTPEWENEFPAQAYIQNKYASCTAAHKKVSYERLEWIFRNLVFTNDERDSLIYAIKQSELIELGADKIDALANIRPPDAAPIKQVPRNPARRTKKIVVKPPKDGEVISLSAEQLRVQHRQAMYNAIAGR